VRIEEVEGKQGKRTEALEMAADEGPVVTTAQWVCNKWIQEPAREKIYCTFQMEHTFLLLFSVYLFFLSFWHVGIQFTCEE
jgi:hypothetical protein